MMFLITQNFKYRSAAILFDRITVLVIMACGKTVLCLGLSLMKDYWPNSPAELNNIIINQAAVVTYQILFIACLDLFL